MKYLFASSIALFLLLFSSCTQDEDVVLENFNQSSPPKTELFSTFSGVVLDVNQNALSDVAVSIGESMTTTNELGLFSLDGYFNSEGTLVRLQKDGYFTTNGYVIPIVDEESQIKLYLRERITELTIDSEKDNDISNDDYSLQFSESSFVDEDQTAYSGDVSVYVSHMSPSSADFNEFFSGTMLSKESEAESFAIQSYGVIQVDLVGNNMQDLDINKSASLSMTIPTNLLNGAPDELSLFSLDESNGLWVKEGRAIKEGNQYIAEVSHFSTWTIGTAYDLVSYTATVLRDGQANPYATINVNDGINQRKSRTTNEGTVSFGTYADRDITVQVENSCGDIIYEDNVSIGSTDVVEEIAISDPIEYLEVSGSLTCGGESTEGTIFVFGDNNVIPFSVTSDQNSYTFKIEKCGSTNIRYYGVDANSNKISEIRNVQESTTDDIEICEEVIMNEVILEIYTERESPNGPTNIAGVTIEFSNAVMVTGTEIVDGEMHTFYELSAVDKTYDDASIEANYAYRWTVGPDGDVIYGGNFTPTNTSDLPYWYDVSILYIDSSITVIDGRYEGELLAGSTKRFANGESGFFQNSALKLNVEVK